MKCVNCGEIMRNEDAYCRNCGVKVENHVYYVILNVFICLIIIAIVIIGILFVASFYL